MRENRPVTRYSGKSGSYGHPGNPHISAFDPAGGGSQYGGGQNYSGGYYPGLQQQPYYPPGMGGGQGLGPAPTTNNFPAVVQPNIQVLPAASASKSKGLFGGLISVDQIKTFVDRMGGIEGIIGTVTKVQSIMSQFSQVAPMVKMLFSVFSGDGKEAVKTTSSKSKKKSSSKKTGKKTVPQKRPRR